LKWLDPAVASALFAVSLACFVAGIVLVPLVIARMPADYFVRSAAQRRGQHHHPAWRLARLALQNGLGAVLLLAGVAMLVLPGQGILTILAALTLLTFPGKRRLQLSLMRRRTVHRVVSAIRRRAGKPPLQLD